MVAAVLAVALVLFAGTAEARFGGGSSFGSRGFRTWSSPPVTETAPGIASPIQRSITPQSGYGRYTPYATPYSGGWFGRGFMGGLFGGLLGAGLFGLFFGHGFFWGLGGFGSLFGLLLQLGLIFLLIRWLFRGFGPPRGIYATAPMSGSSHGRGDDGASYRYDTPPASRPGGPQPLGYGASTDYTLNRGNHDGLGLAVADFNEFERLLGEIQTAYGREDLATLIFGRGGVLRGSAALRPSASA